MKCIRGKRNGIVTRTSNQEAYSLVKSGEYEFVTKKMWREETRDKRKRKPMPDMASKVEPVSEADKPHVHLKSKERKVSKP